MKKNLLIYVEDPRFGGPHQYSLNIFDELKKNFNIRFIISNKENQIFLKKLKIKRANVKILPLTFLSLKFYKILSYFFFFIYEICLLRQNIKKDKIDIIYSISGLYSFKVILSTLFLNKKIVVHFHDAYCNIFFRCLSFFTKNFIDLSVYSSKKSFNFYSKYVGKNNYLITPSSIKINKLKKKEKKNKKFFNIVTIANINPIKNLELLIMIAANIRYIKKIRFFIIGKVWKSQIGYYKNIKKLIKTYKLKNIFFNNLNNEKEIKNKLMSSDIYLCTSKNESSPMSIWEAMSCHLPVLSTNIGDLDIYNTKYNFGFIIKNETVDNFKNCILYLYKKKYMRVKFGNKSAICAINEFDIKKTCKILEQKLIKL
jgi:glycosyltransferase involved in cell wall biosynthesis